MNTSKYLQEFIKGTQEIATKALKKLDYNAYFNIQSSLDISIPYDVDRLAGGFPTGVYLEWNCNVPIVPVDATVNCCTASVLEISKNFDISKFVYNLYNLNKLWENSSYLLNFNSGNHFISLCFDKCGRFYLVMHSTAKEFTKGYNGLYPIKGNWYYDKIQVFESFGRYFRYLIGEDANLFSKTAISLNSFNEIRHENIAYSLLQNCSSIKNVKHWHHYGMSTNNAIQIGCYVVNKGESFPLFSKPNYSIDIFKVNYCSKINQQGRFIVPHGWGKILPSELNIDIDINRRRIIVGNSTFNIFNGESLNSIPNLKYRDFEKKDGSNGFYQYFQSDLQGTVEHNLFQYVSLNSNGINIIEGEPPIGI